MTSAKWLIPIVGAFIGWITNVIAIWLLFHPYKKTLGIQGLLPKNKDAMADKLGKLVKEHLLDNETLIRAINLEEKIKEILNKLIKDLNPLTRAVLKNLVDHIAAFLKQYLEKELKTLPDIIQIDKIVAEKIKNFNLRELEHIIYQATGREIRFIQLAGAVLGFIIGVVQLLLFQIL